MPGLIELLRASCTDLRKPPIDQYETLAQIIVNTHSPAVLKVVKEDEVVTADVVVIGDEATKTVSRRTRMRKGWVDGQLPLGDGDRMTRYETDQLLRREPEQA